MDPIKAVFTFCAALFFALSPLLSDGFGTYDPELFPDPQWQAPAHVARYGLLMWGVIYVWTLLSAGFGMIKRGQDPAWDSTRLPLILCLAPGTVWASLSGTDPVMATVLIVWMLITAVWALFRSPATDRWWLQAPLALYAGWLTYSAWASVALIGAGFGIPLGNANWALVALGGALATGSMVQKRLSRAPEFGLALIWAFVAVAVAHWADQAAVMLTAAFCAVVMGAVSWRVR